VPSFLYGNSLGGLILNTFLLRNPDLKLAGVIFSAPLFGFAESHGVTWYKKVLLKMFNPILQVSNFQITRSLEFFNLRFHKNT